MNKAMLLAFMLFSPQANEAEAVCDQWARCAATFIAVDTCKSTRQSYRDVQEAMTKAIYCRLDTDRGVKEIDNIVLRELNVINKQIAPQHCQNLGRLEGRIRECRRMIDLSYLRLPNSRNASSE